MRHISLCCAVTILSVFVGGGCGSKSSDGATEGTPVSDSSEPEDRAGKADRWDSANNPAYVDENFAYFVHQLPAEGHGPIPIPAYYWPIANDTINDRWAGEGDLSPAEKYEKAFSKSGVVQNVTQFHGIEAAGTKPCTQGGNECSGDDGSCSIPRGKTKGFCIPGWWGICHGWAPYALQEPAATKAVQRGGVTFYPADLEALMSLLYTEVPTKFLSQRCNKERPGMVIDPASNRIKDGECRDMNPGSFHVLTTNMMGLRKQGFVIDQTTMSEVWNQPAYGYRITNAVNGKVPELSKADAIAKVGGQGSEYTYNTDAKRFFYVEMDFSFIVESMPAMTSHYDTFRNYLQTKHYQYVLEADDTGKIFGGEWVGNSKSDHPDFAWWPTAKAVDSAMAGGLITYQEVKSLNDEAVGAHPTPVATLTVLDNAQVGASGEWDSIYGSVVVEAGYDQLKVDMTGTGAAELYVKGNRNPTTSDHDCVSKNGGTATQTCTVNVPKEGQAFFIRVRSNKPGTSVTVSATKVSPNPSGGACRQLNETCGDSEECCSKSCDGRTLTCIDVSGGVGGSAGAPGSECRQPGETCGASNECCSDFCDGRTKTCIDVGGAGGSSSGTCMQAGATCARSNECCSDFCRSENLTCL